MKIQDLKIVFICPDHNEKYSKRKQHMLNLLGNMGCKDITHYKSGTEKHPACIIYATIDILTKYADVPILVLEDDLEYTGIEDFDFVENADAIYFGISKDAGDPVKNIHITRPGVDCVAEFSEYSNNQVRILNMLSGHAILYISERYKRAVIDTLTPYISIPYYNDVLISRIQRNFTILANKKPSFFQSHLFNDGYHVENRTRFTID